MLTTKEEILELVKDYIKQGEPSIKNNGIS